MNVIDQTDMSTLGQIDWLNSFIFVIADNVKHSYKTQPYHTKHKDKMALHGNYNFLKTNHIHAFVWDM